MRDRDRTPPIERVAAVTERLAVLLAAGVRPSAAWGYLASGAASRQARDRPDPARISEVLAAAAAAAQAGGDVSAAMAEAARGAAGGAERRAAKESRDSPAADAWLPVAAAWSVAIETGAPLAGCLHELARSQRALGQAQRDIDAALAGPRSTSRLVLVLPVVGLLFGLLLGFDTLGTLVGTVPGLVCLAGAALLMLAAWRWSTAMVRRSTPRSSAPGLAIDLTAIAMSSGASVDRAVAVVTSALAEFRPREPAARATPRSAPLHEDDREDAAIRGVLALSRAAGVPAAELLRGEADHMRRDARSSAQQAAASLATRLMLPLGLCILPAFMLVGVAPLLLSVLSSTVRGIG
jgi:tight adherence protein B